MNKVSWILGLGALLMLGVLTCNSCELKERRREAEVVEATMHLQPTATTTVSVDSDAPATSEPQSTMDAQAEQGELWTVHPLEPKLVGKWEDIDGRPLPTVEFITDRPGSKTTWNLTFQTERMIGGCGFDAALDAWCAVYDDSGKSVPRKVKSTIAILTNGSALRIAVDQLFRVDVRRATVPPSK